MINSLLVLVSLSVYTFDVSKTMFEDKEGVRTITARLQGEDKPSPLLCYAQVATSSIVGAMACPRPGAHAKIVRAPCSYGQA